MWADLAVSSDSKESLLPSDKLHWPQRCQGLGWGGHFDLCPFDAAQLTSVVVAPAVDGATAPGGQDPVIRPPVHPLHELLVVLAFEQVVTLVEAVHALVVGHKLTNLLCDLQKEWKWILNVVDVTTQCESWDKHLPRPGRVLAMRSSCLEPQPLWRLCSSGETRPTCGSQHSRARCPALGHRPEQPRPEKNENKGIQLLPEANTFVIYLTYCHDYDHTLKNGL